MSDAAPSVIFSALLSFFFSSCLIFESGSPTRPRGTTHTAPPRQGFDMDMVLALFCSQRSIRPYIRTNVECSKTAPSTSRQSRIALKHVHSLPHQNTVKPRSLSACHTPVDHPGSSRSTKRLQRGARVRLTRAVAGPSFAPLLKDQNSAARPPTLIDDLQTISSTQLTHVAHPHLSRDGWRPKTRQETLQLIAGS